MPDPNLQFDPTDGWNNTTTFPTSPTSQAQTRTLFQRLFTQIQTFINSTYTTWINATFATKADLTGAVLSGVADNSLTNAKLGTDIKIGSNAALATTSKSTIVGAINEVFGMFTSYLSTTVFNSAYDEDIGKIEYFAMQTPPTRRLEANGAAVSRTTYAKLFAAIGTTYGAGDNSTTFNLPDMRGVFPRGWDNGKGYDGGRIFGSYQADGNKSHSHTGTTGVESQTHTHSYNWSGGAGGTSPATNNAYGTANTGTQSQTHTHSFTTSADGNTEATVKNIALLAVIKF